MYYDKYAYGTNYFEYTRGHFGDATSEMEPFKYIEYENNLSGQINSWYSADANFVDYEYPWFVRGGTYSRGIASNLFGFARADGILRDNMTFRLVLIP